MNDQSVDILLVEDDDYEIENLRSLIDIDKQLTLKHISKNCDDATSYLKCEGNYNNVCSPMLVLVDADVSNHSGITLFENIINTPEFYGMSVVTLASNEHDEEKIKLSQKGRNYVIRKPVDHAKIQDAFKEFSLYWGLVASKPHLAEQLG